MKKYLFLLMMLLFTSVSYAQRDDSFYRHEVKLSVGDALAADLIWFIGDEVYEVYYNVSIAYSYRLVKWFWVGGNFVNYFGNIIYRDRLYYDMEGSLDPKRKYVAVIAPEIRFSYLNKERAILYSSFSAGIGWENGYDRTWQEYPQRRGYAQITYFGFSINSGKNNNIFLGGELGLGFKGFLNFHGGYRF